MLLILAMPAQTDRGRIFEMLADLMDEDGALAEMEDLDMLGIWLIRRCPGGDPAQDRAAR